MLRLKKLSGIVAFLVTASSVLAQENSATTVNQTSKLLDLTVIGATEPPTPAPVPQLAPTADFAEDSWSYQAYGSATIGNPRRGKLYEGHIGFGYYFLDNISINAEFTGIGTATRDHGGETGHDGAGGGFDLLFRWHLLHGESWSIYTEGGAGLLQLTEPFPANGTGFNFTPQFGFGGTLRVFENWRLMAGARYQHISNAGLHGPSHNPGFDGAMVYAGLIMPF